MFMDKCTATEFSETIKGAGGGGGGVFIKILSKLTL